MKRHEGRAGWFFVQRRELDRKGRVGSGGKPASGQHLKTSAWVTPSSRERRWGATGVRTPRGWETRLGSWLRAAVGCLSGRSCRVEWEMLECVYWEDSRWWSEAKHGIETVAEGSISSGCGGKRRRRRSGGSCFGGEQA